MKSFQSNTETHLAFSHLYQPSLLSKLRSMKYQLLYMGNQKLLQIQNVRYLGNEFRISMHTFIALSR